MDLIGGSANEGVGIYEYFNCVMEAGTYFFAVGGYEGTGNFAFAYYQSTSDVSYEENDSLETAASIELSNDIEGVIDSPYDIDYYKFTLLSPTIIQYSISSEKGYSLKLTGAVGDNAAVYKVNFSNGSYEFMPGTYYFAVHSENGNPIDIRYEYKFSLSNNNGLQNLSITLKDSDKIRCQIWREETQGPEVVFYRESTKPYRTVGSKPLLHLLFYGELDTGKLVDISEYNYFYQHIMGGNRIIYNKPYTMSFRYNLRDGLNQIGIKIDMYRQEHRFSPATPVFRRFDV
ncbi:MAG: hypothetical protein HFI77_05215 [Lachnospiraceae bacterium]|nr:hypothetical protein [Lachnospiraceae bacterium]